MAILLAFAFFICCCAVKAIFHVSESSDGKKQLKLNFHSGKSKWPLGTGTGLRSAGKIRN